MLILSKVSAIYFISYIFANQIAILLFQNSFMKWKLYRSSDS